MICDLQTSVPDWIIDYPETEVFFKEKGIDASCEGKSLEYICLQQGHDPQEVLRRLLRICEK